MIKVITLQQTFMMLIVRLEQSLMKNRSSKHQNNKGIWNKRFHGWCILLLKTMRLLVNNKRQPYSSPHMFNNNLFLQRHHGNFGIV
jgi:hypothetical protein